ncbi:MAG: holin family protein [Pseudomonadota bacterium]
MVARGIEAVATLGRAAKGVAGVFRADATAGQALEHAAHRAALEQLGGEFERPARGRFDRVVDGLNRLPRPFLALGTLGLFVYAMVEPLGFAARMQGLAYVPDPLWWLLGAIVGFYFGARELHYRRVEPSAPRPEPVHSAWHAGPAEPPEEDWPTEESSDNAALSDWRRSRG